MPSSGSAPCKHQARPQPSGLTLGHGAAGDSRVLKT
eukprot:CAMPEP_0179955534 /NCGR_PEP_ID=MMETSP0983-20121128/26236_1 /TAXON_ID=483367 /ORGANISM="non described non described, Strain CCMP 2436" /LENGTH=35 /DNA_ID= /DNA_START= /DNA_END= /DNA_ORIENTATION=